MIWLVYVLLYIIAGCFVAGFIEQDEFWFVCLTIVIWPILVIVIVGMCAWVIGKKIAGRD